MSPSKLNPFYAIGSVCITVEVCAKKYQASGRHIVARKGVTLLLPVTSPDADGFSNSFMLRLGRKYNMRVHEYRGWCKTGADASQKMGLTVLCPENKKVLQSFKCKLIRSAGSL